MKKICSVLIITVFFAFIQLIAKDKTDVLDQIENIIKFGENADMSLSGKVKESIEKNPGRVSQAMKKKLNKSGLTEIQSAVYIWAAGLTKDQSLLSLFESYYNKSSSEQVISNCINAISTTGGDKAAETLLRILKSKKDEKWRFEILSTLSRMQYGKALPETEDILKKDMNSFYWQSVFIFGKMGDKSIPFLLERIGSKNRNIRANTINVLGQWLISPESVKPLQEQYWKEEDKELRRMILFSLERTTADPDQVKSFFDKVVKKEKDPEIMKFAQETLSDINKLKTVADKFSSGKKISAVSFQSEYEKIFNSFGKSGNYEILGKFSTINDEKKLKALRERILQRGSDECFYDYSKINDIIMLNRLIENSKNKK